MVRSLENYYCIFSFGDARGWLLLLALADPSSHLKGLNDRTSLYNLCSLQVYVPPVTIDSKLASEAPQPSACASLHLGIASAPALHETKITKLQDTKNRASCCGSLSLARLSGPWPDATFHVSRCRGSVGQATSSIPVHQRFFQRYPRSCYRHMSLSFVIHQQHA